MVLSTYKVIFFTSPPCSVPKWKRPTSQPEALLGWLYDLFHFWYCKTTKKSWNKQGAVVLYRSESLAGFWYLCRSEVLPGEISAFWWVERLRIAATAVLPAAPTHREVKRTNAMSSRRFSTWDENSSFNFWNRQRACGGIPPLFKSVAGNLFLQATPSFKGQLVFLLSVGRPSFLLNCLASVRNYDGMILSNWETMTQSTSLLAWSTAWKIRGEIVILFEFFPSISR